MYDTKKHVWLQGREAWMFARLYNEHADYHTPQILAASKLGIDFLRKHAHRPHDHRVYFCVDQEGKVGAACMAMHSAVMWVCTAGQAAAQGVCGVLLHHGAVGVCARNQAQVCTHLCPNLHCAHVCLAAVMSRPHAPSMPRRWRSSKPYTAGPRWKPQHTRPAHPTHASYAQDLSKVGQDVLDGQIPSRALAIPMMLLCVLCELRKHAGAETAYEEMAVDCIAAIKLHVKTDTMLVAEVVGMEGAAVLIDAGMFPCNASLGCRGAVGHT